MVAEIYQVLQVVIDYNAVSFREVSSKRFPPRGLFREIPSDQERQSMDNFLGESQKDAKSAKHRQLKRCRPKYSLEKVELYL